MLEQITHFFFKTNSGRVVLVVLVAMGLAYAARIVLVDMPALQEKDAARAGEEALEAMADQLSAVYDERGDEIEAELPRLTDWYPASVPCATDIEFPTPREPVWDLLGLPAAGRTQFQYRFQFLDGRFNIRARRDVDCDGFYAVWLIEGRASSLLGRDLTAQNILE